MPAALGLAVQLPREQSGDELRGTGMVLVIDDEPSVRMSAKRILERYGYQILIAEDGQVGLDMFRENAAQIVAILLDMAMPVMSGEETFRKIRSIRSDACVILSSGYNEVETVRRFSATGIAAFIQKPYTAASLARVIKRAITDATE